MGRIGDKIGEKRVFVATLIALAVGSPLAAAATNVQVMIIARVIQGIGGGVLPLAFIAWSNASSRRAAATLLITLCSSRHTTGWRASWTLVRKASNRTR